MTRCGTIAAALVLVAVSLVFCPCDAQFSLGPSFVLNQTGLVVAEGIAWEMTVHQDSPKGKARVKCSTPNGYYTKFTVVDPLTSQGEVYLTYDINGSTICYAYAVGTLPYPFPPTVLHYNYLKQGTYGGTAMPLYEIGVGRYRLRMFSNFQSITGSETFRVVQTNPEAMNQLQDTYISNNTESSASVFDLPPACSQGSVRRLRAAKLPQQVISSSLSATVDPFHVSRLGIVPPEVKFNVRDARHAHDEFRMVIDEAMAVLGPQRLSEYRAAPHAAAVTSIDNRAYATAIRDQGTCGGCWAFSTAALTETVYNYKHNITNPVGSSNQWVSVQNILDCATGDLNGTALFPSKGCFGGWPLVGLTHIVLHGVVAEAGYTYDAVNGHNCLQSASGESTFPLQAAQYIPYGNAPATNVPLLMSAIVTNGAVIAIMNADPILFYGGGIFTSPCAASLGHAVTLVGFGSDPVSGTDYWIVKNSFGAAWGEGGFFRIARGVNLCGIEQMGFVAVAALKKKQKKNR